MALQIKFSRDLKNLLKANDQKGLVPRVRQEFTKRGPIKFKQAMVQDMIRGISPVKGKGKWKKYSQSYKDVIRGVATYFKKNGKVIRVSKGNAKNKAAQAFVKARHAKFQAGASPTKKVQPVNLRYSGDLHRSLKVSTTGGYFTNFRLVVAFKNKLADIHNRRGAGKSKVKRRLLPTKTGEQFNRRLTQVLIEQLKKAVETVAKDNSGQ